MSVMEFTPAATAGLNRRRKDRVKMKSLLRVHIGRGMGMVQDISAAGIRLRHTGMLSRGARTRMAFDWRLGHFAGTAEVLASRVVSLGTGEQNGTVYETRFRFITMTHDSHDLLLALLAAESENSLTDECDSMVQ